MSALALVVLIASAPLTEDPDYQTAIKLYEDVEFEQALFRFQSAAVRPDLNDAERAELFLWIGLCYGNIGDLESAERQFRDGLKLFPSAPLPQPNTSPIIIDLFTRVKADVQAAAAATTTADPPADTPPTAEAPPTEASSTDAPPSAEGSEGGGLPWILIGGGSAAAAGVVLLVAASATAGASYFVFAQGLSLGEDNTVFASDLKGVELMANVLLGSAASLAVLGVVVVVAGGATAGASFALE